MALVNSSRFTLDEGIQWAVKKYLQDYNGDIIEEVSKVTTEVARESVKKLKAASPKESGKYARGWTYKLDKGRMTHGATIYGKSGTYQLAHLLEFGHVSRNGTHRDYGTVKAVPHIKTVEEWAVGEVVDRTIERLSSL